MARVTERRMFSGGETDRCLVQPDCKYSGLWRNSMKFRSKAMTGMLALLTVLGSAGCSKLKARDEMNKGVRSFKESKYETAVEHFKTAVSLDPELTNAHLYLAAAYASQYQPGGDSPENRRIGEEA